MAIDSIRVHGVAVFVFFNLKYSSYVIPLEEGVVVAGAAVSGCR